MRKGISGSRDGLHKHRNGQVKTKAEHGKDEKDIHEVLHSISPRIRRVGGKGVEGISKSALTDKLESDARHPAQQINCTWTVLDARLDRLGQLRSGEAS